MGELLVKLRVRHKILSQYDGIRNFFELSKLSVPTS
jgi:hypothetical protein